MKCSICKSEKFINTTPDRPYKVCANCEAMERHRALWNIISENIIENAKIIDISPISKYLFKEKFKEVRPDIQYIGIDKYKSGNPLDKRDSAFCDMYFDLVEIDEHLKDESFDIVIMQHVLEEIQDYKKCLYNIKRVMKKDAIAYLEIPNTDYLVEHINHEPNKYGNVWEFSKTKLYKELQEIFKEVSIIEYNECEFRGNFFVCKK